MCPRVVRCYTASMKSLAMCLLQLLVFTAWAQTAEPPQTWAVTMRDGIHLATDVYGADPNTRKPALLMRTPYERHGPRASAERFAMAGYAVVLQDTRGASASEGKYVHYNNDDQDGFDTIEWIARQPWANGKVGMGGTSHPGGGIRVGGGRPPAESGGYLSNSRCEQPVPHHVPGRCSAVGAPGGRRGFASESPSHGSHSAHRLHTNS